MHNWTISLCIVTVGFTPLWTVPANGSPDWEVSIRDAEQLRLRDELPAAAALLEGVLRQNEAAGDRQLAITLHNLASVYMDQNRFLDAERCYLRALAHAERLPADQIVMYGTILNNLMDAYFEWRKPEKADLALLGKMADRLEKSAPGSNELAHLYNTTGLILAAQKRLAEAEPCYRRALDILRHLQDPAAPSAIVSVLASLGSLKTTMGQYTESLAIFEEALSRVRGFDPPDPATTSKLLSSIAAIYCVRNDPWQALRFSVQAVALADQSVRVNPMEHSVILLTYADILRHCKRNREARAAGQRARDIVARYMHASHEDQILDARSLRAGPEYTNPEYNGTAGAKQARSHKRAIQQ